MFNDSYIYKFDEFSLDSEEEELKRGDEVIPLERRAFQILLLLVENAGKFFDRNEILKKVWKETIVEDSNVDVQLSKIRTALGQNEDRIFIERKNKRFKFVIPVQPIVKTRQTFVKEVVENEQNGSDDRSDAEEISKLVKNGTDSVSFGLRNWLVVISVTLVALYFYYLGVGFSSNLAMDKFQLAFIYLNSFFYGALAAITLVLETAYEFHKHRRNVARMAPFIFLINSTAMYGGLMSASGFLPDKPKYAFFTGLLFLVIGTSLACLLAFFVLPDTQITKSKEEETQPAFLAFLKNVGFYFFSVYLFFGLFIFCLTYGSTDDYKSMSFAFVFLLIWGFLTLLVWISINLFNSSLKTVKDGEAYRGHSLFVLMSYLRLIFCFLPTLINIGIYFFSIK